MKSKYSCWVVRAMLAVVLMLCGGTLWAKGDLSGVMFTRLNAARTEKGLPAMTRDAALDRAAQLQAEWCSKHDTLQHEQPGRLRTLRVANRVALSHGTHDLLSEIVLDFVPNAGRPAAEWAQQAVDQGIFHPQDAAIALDSNNRWCGVGLLFDKKSSLMYVTFVFAQARWQPPVGAHLNRRAFGIHEPKRDKDCKTLDKHAALQNKFLYGWGIEPPDSGDRKMKLYFGHSGYSLSKPMLRKPRGKLAPDIVFREQFPCNQPNQLHGSPYHDGYLRRPRGWGYMALWHDWAVKKYDKDLLVRTHRLPVMNTDSLQLNMVVSKKHGYCRYGIPFTIPQKLLGPYSYEFAPDTIAFGQRDNWRRKQLTFKVPFQKSGTEPDVAAMQPLLDSLVLPGAELMSVRIRGYASVEGTLEINQDLYKRRADRITAIIQGKQTKPVRMTSSSAENWADFKKDLRGTQWAPLLRLSNDKVRDTLQRNRSLLAALEPTLAKHRYASVEIDLRFAVDNTITNDWLRDSLRHALDAKNFAAAHALQSEMWRRWEDRSFPVDSILAVHFPRVEACLPMIHNQYCLRERMGLLRHQDTSDPLVKLSKTYPWFAARQVLGQSIAASRPLFCVPFPTGVLRNIQNLRKRNIPAELMRRIELNYYVGLGIYKSQGEVVDKKILKEVYSRFVIDSLDLAEAVELGKYYNACRAMDETIKLMKPLAKSGFEDEDFVFLYAWTALHHQELVSEDEWLRWMEQAHKLNPDRWKKKVDVDWQLLRWPRLKALYCGCAVAQEG